MQLRAGIGVATAIVRDGRLLLGRRIARFGNGLWQTPGGKPNRGESLEAAAVRETFEECGLVVSQPREIARQFDDFPEIGYRYETVFFAVRCDDGEPRNCEPDKCEGWRWHPLDDLPDDRFAIDAATVAAILNFARGDVVAQEIGTLAAASTHLALATVDAAGLPHASYVPYALARVGLVFAGSALAAHAAHLAARPQASLLIVGGRTSDPYARTRLTIAANVRPLPARGEEAEAAWSALQAHGATAAILRTLPDFTVYATLPESGRLILGFASAHDVPGELLARALREQR